MKRSIESIWKEGFLEDKNQLAPQINNLYSQKSIHMMEQFQRMFRNNLIGILIGALILAGVALFIQSYLFGLILVSILLGLVWMGKSQMNDLAQIDKGSNSFDYLQAFKNWLDHTMGTYEKLYRYVYPIILMCFVLGAWFSRPLVDTRADLLNNSDYIHVLGIPLFILLPLIGMMIIIGISAKWLYKIDMKSIYGEKMRRIDELLHDMEELRSFSQ